jgi:hypothetical protein
LDLTWDRVSGSREKRQDNLATGSRDCEKRYPDSWRIVWAIEKSTSGIQVARKPSGSRRKKPQSIGVRTRDLARSEVSAR